MLDDHTAGYPPLEEETISVPPDIIAAIYQNTVQLNVAGKNNIYSSFTIGSSDYDKKVQTFSFMFVRS